MTFFVILVVIVLAGVAVAVALRSRTTRQRPGPIARRLRESDGAPLTGTASSLKERHGDDTND